MARGTVISDERLGQLLAGVGNHEAKALLFLAMEDDELYGVSSLHRLSLQIQGDRPAFVGTVNLQQKYVVHSFEPIGLVARTLAGGRYLRHMKLDDDRVVTALCGHLLRVSEHHPASLTQLFGKSAAGGERTRAPIRRISVLRALGSSNGPVTQAWLAEVSGDGVALGNTLAALAAAGVIEYEVRPTYELKTSYVVERPIVLGTGPRELTRCIAGYLDDRLERNGGRPVTIDRDEIEDHLLAREPWTGHYIRDTVQKVMARLVDRGLVLSGEDYRGRISHSLVSLTEGQRGFLNELLESIERVQRADRAAVDSGVEYARLLLAEPKRVRALIRKTFSKNKIVVEPVPRHEKQQLVLAVLGDGPATAGEIHRRLSPRLNKQLTGGTLSELARAGLVVAHTLPRSPQKLWRLAEPPG